MKTLPLLRLLALVFSLLGSSATLPAVIVAFDLMGIGGTGLLPTNEIHAVTSGGSGGELGGGISYDTATNQLTLNVGWGSGNGFTNLSGNATLAHVHGPAAQSATAGVLYDIIGGSPQGSVVANANASSGGISGFLTLSESHEANLLSGLLYLNVHTATNGSGEIRGNLIAVPEPSAYALLAGLLGLGLVLRRRFARA